MALELHSESQTNRNVNQGTFCSGEIFKTSHNYSEIETKEEEGLSEKVFSIPLILKGILKNLETEGLLRTSLVNKHWNFFSREILRETKKCLTRVERKDIHSCEYLKKLNDLLLTSETVPFSGISLTVFSNNVSAFSVFPSHECITAAERSELMSNIWSKINIKYLQLCFFGCSSVFENCVALECIREILEEGRSLEELCVYVTDDLSTLTFSELIGSDLQSRWLSNIRVLEFPFDYEESPVPSTRSVRDLVEASPKLQVMRGYIGVQDLDFIVHVKACRAVKDFDFRPTIESLGNCEAFSLQSPKLRKIIFSTSNFIGRNRDSRVFSEWPKSLQKKVCRILKQLLKSSEDSLKFVSFDHPDLILMTSQWNVPPLKKVTHLRLRYYSGIDVDERYGYSTLRKIEWAKYFPNLKEVYVTDDLYGSDNIENNFYICESFRELDAEFVCDTVTKLSWNSVKDFDDFRTVPILRKIFPNVKEFYLPRDEQIFTFLYELWTAWENLETLSVSIEVDSVDCNYDSDFLGISTAESYDLLENAEDCESLKIISTYSCIFDLRNLKKLVISIIHDEDMCHYRSDNAVVLSLIAVQYVLSKMPGLTVEIHREICENGSNCCFALSHLKPFISCSDSE